LARVLAGTVMTEAEARNLLRAHQGVGGLELWMAAQPWRPAPGGWQLSRELDGWRFRLQPIEDGLRVSATAPGGNPPEVWLVKQ
jgi:hypothetical protein